MAHLREERQMAVGPWCTASFENWETLWFQVQETQYLERCSHPEAQAEVDAYSSLVPGEGELTLRLDFDLRAVPAREKLQQKLEGVEALTALWLDGTVVHGIPEPPLLSPATPTFHHVRFRMSPYQRFQFISCRSVELEIGHPVYRVRALMPQRLRMVLAADWTWT